MIRIAISRPATGPEPRERKKAIRKEQEALLLLLLPVITGRHYSALPEAARMPGGKPCLPSAADFHYSFSDSGDYLVLAASDREVGCDLQCMTGYQKYEAFSQRFFSEGEAAAITALPEKEGQALFFSLWTMKEAYFKFTGEGIFHGISGCTAPALLDPGRDPLAPFSILDERPDRAIRTAVGKQVPFPDADYVLTVAAGDFSALEDVRLVSSPVLPD